ncbi:hypothetical protein EDB19DRAFT_919405 [Suillus lakei]|nr:hypothetical protein EDB19DRAFT_919405 [Suillus lakei]
MTVSYRHRTNARVSNQIHNLPFPSPNAGFKPTDPLSNKGPAKQKVLALGEQKVHAHKSNLTEESSCRMIRLGTLMSSHQTLRYQEHQTLLHPVHHPLRYQEHQTLLHPVHHPLRYQEHQTLRYQEHQTLLHPVHQTLLHPVHQTLLHPVHQTLLHPVHQTLLGPSTTCLMLTSLSGLLSYRSTRTL